MVRLPDGRQVISSSGLRRVCLALGWLGFTIAAAVTSGCAPMRPVAGNMVLPGGALPAPPADRALAQTLRVSSVSRGLETKPRVLSKIWDGEFRAALEQSLMSSGLLTPQSFNAKYLLEAELVQAHFSRIRISDFSVTMTVDYRLKEASTGTLVWQYAISTPYTAKSSEAFIGAVRLRLANEGATRANIKELIDTLYQIGSARLDV